MSQSLNPRRSSFTPTTARGPRVGLFGAVLLHGAIVAAAIFTWQHRLDFTDVSPPVVPVDLVTIADKTNIAPTVRPQPKVEPKENPTPPQLVTPKPTPPPPTPPAAEAAPDQAPSQPVLAKAAPLPKPMPKPQTPPAPDQKKPKTDDFSALLNKLTAPAAAPRNARTDDRTV